MRSLVTIIVLAAGLGVVAELIAPSLVESRIEEQVRAESRGAARVEAEVDSFPLVTRLLVTEEVEEVEVTLVEVADVPVPLATVRFGLEGLVVDRSALLRGEVEIRDVATGLLEVEITAAQLSEALGAPVRLEPGRVTVEVGGEPLTAEVQAGPSELQLVVEGVGTESIPLPAELIDCEPMIAVADGRIVASCRISEVPSVLVRAAAR